MLTKVFYDWSKLNALKPDTKTPKNQQVEKTGNVYPQPRQRDNLTIHLKMTEVWWKCRVLPFIFIVLSVEAFEFQTQNRVVFDTYNCYWSIIQFKQLINDFANTFRRW